jgi:hypothetical protein
LHVELQAMRGDPLLPSQKKRYEMEKGRQALNAHNNNFARQSHASCKCRHTLKHTRKAGLSEKTETQQWWTRASYVPRVI